MGRVARVRVADDSMTGDQPTYRDLWLRIREDLPKKGRKTGEVSGEPKLPVELQGALHSLYSNYEKYYSLWEQNPEAAARGITPPVFIVVCNNTNVSKLVFDFIAGWEKKMGEKKKVKGGQLLIFRNDDGHGPDDLLNLLLEITGEKKKDKAAKVATACTLWVPAINNHGGFGRWAFLEIDDPWNAKNVIRKRMSAC